MDDNRSLRNEFEYESRHLPLTSTGIDTIIDAAGRRRRRHSVAVAGGALTLIAVTGVGIQQLSRVDSEVAPLAPTETLAPIPSTGPVASIPAAPSLTDEIGVDLSGAVPAVAIGPVMTWTVIDADGPEATALKYGNADQQYALATEPAGPQQASNALYEQRDGEWDLVTSNVLPEGLGTATISGDAIYAVGTAPAAAGELPGSVGHYDIATEAWTLTALPAPVRPYRSEAVRSATEMTITPLDNGALVVINRWKSSIDYELVTTVLGERQVEGEWHWVDGALDVPVDCDQIAIEEQLALLEQGNWSGNDFEAAYRQASTDHCTLLRVSAEELGLDAADVEELSRPQQTSVFEFGGQQLTEVALPDPAAQSARLSRNLLFTSSPEAGRTWIVRGDGSFEPVFEGLGELGGGNAREFDGVVSTGISGVIATSAPGAEATLVDLSPVILDDTMVNPTAWVNSVAANPTATIATVGVEYKRAGATTEPVTIEGSGYNLVVEPESGVTVVDRATGETLASGYRLVTEPGVVKLVHAGQDGALSTSPPSTLLNPVPQTVVPSLPGEPDSVLDEFDVDWSTLGPWAHAHHTSIVSSLDGSNYAVESFTDLVNVAEGETAEANRIDIIDGRFVISGWVWNDTGNTRQVVLIGTPNA